MAQPQTIARPYAKAVFSLADSDAKQQQWQQFLHAAAELTNSPEVAQHLRTPGFIAQLEQWLDEWLKQARKEGVSEQERNFLRTLEDHGRVSVLPEIADAFTELCSQSHNTCIVHVKTAAQMDDAAQKALSDSLAKKLGKAVALEVEEAPELMAGVVIEYDGQVIDQSMQGRLQQFARKLDD